MATFRTPELDRPDHKDLEIRLRIETLHDSDRADHLAVQAADQNEILNGLAQPQKTLPSKYFYDQQGSELFEEICHQPEYYPTRTEAWILDHYAGEIAEVTGSCELVELGSGSSTKTRALLNAYRDRGEPLRYVPIDVSRTILTESARQLLRDYPTLHVRGTIATYERALAKLGGNPTAMNLPARMLIFLGSTLGNFTPDESDRFFMQVHDFLGVGDYFLLGVDLHKETAQLEAAYNDAQGITAHFNLNILNHLNHRFATNFDRSNFEHWAFYNEDDRQIEMHLRCLKDHEVQLGDRRFSFTQGETIRTEISRKFDLETLKIQLLQYDLEPIQVWQDPQGWFASILTRRRLS